MSDDYNSAISERGIILCMFLENWYIYSACSVLRSWIMNYIVELILIRIRTYYFNLFTAMDVKL